MGMAKNKTPSAQLYMTVNKAVKFYDCGCYTLVSDLHVTQDYMLNAL
jgi:hypothetical protein